MENGKQIQKAGENSQQIQAQTVIVNQGISEERVRTIFSEMLPYALQEYTYEAYALASQRIGKLESNILPKPVSYTHLDVYKRQSDLSGR